LEGTEDGEGISCDWSEVLMRKGQLEEIKEEFDKLVK
jgi:hypothetical protein